MFCVIIMRIEFIGEVNTKVWCMTIAIETISLQMVSKYTFVSKKNNPYEVVERLNKILNLILK